MRLAGMARVALAIATALLGVGCGSGDARPGQRSAFFGDVSQLEPGRGDKPSLLYISPTADFAVRLAARLSALHQLSAPEAAPVPNDGLGGDGASPARVGLRP